MIIQSSIFVIHLKCQCHTINDLFCFFSKCSPTLVPILKKVLLYYKTSLTSKPYSLYLMNHISKHHSPPLKVMSSIFCYLFYFTKRKPLKTDGKYFLIHAKCSFRSQDILYFVFCSFISNMLQCGIHFYISGIIMASYALH